MLRRIGSRSRVSSIQPHYYARRQKVKPRRLQLEPLEDRALLTLAGNQLFPDDSPWNRVISNAPVAANSATLVASIGATSPLHPDFGTMYEGTYIGISYNIVSAGQQPLDVVIDAYPDESDLIDVPIPAGAVIEGDPLSSNDNDGDRHLIIYDEDSNVAYELFRAYRPSETGDGKWHADSEAVWDMNQNSFRTPGDTSADAAGLPILPGLVRPDEVLDQGVINHALRFTVPNSRNAYVFPASHQAGVNNANYPRMGERFRLKQTFDISGFSPTNRVILQALKDYGMIAADNGSPWYLSGSPSSLWDDDELHALTQLRGNNFEAVNLSTIVTSLDQTSGPASGGTAVTVHGVNFSGNAGQLQVRFGTTPATQVSIVSDTVLVATSPANSVTTVHVTVQTPYGTSAATNADQFTFTAGAASSVVGRRLFYNQSGTAGATLRYDGNNLAINSLDDNAIATDKVAYLPQDPGAATFANVSSYSKGINGIMVDISGSHPSISADDFIFRVGNNNSPSSWSLANAPTSISVRAGAGTSGSDRVEIIWNSGAPIKQWLQVIVKANTDTGLAQLAGYPAGQGDVFFFGNAVGNTGAGDTAVNATVNAIDEGGARNNPQAVGDNIPITNLYDFNRNAVVNAVDEGISRNNATNSATVVSYLSISSPPAAPEGDGGDVGLASALTAPAASSSQAGVMPQFGPRLDEPDRIRADGNGDRIERSVSLQVDRTTSRARAPRRAFDAAIEALLSEDEFVAAPW